VEVDGGQTHY